MCTYETPILGKFMRIYKVKQQGPTKFQKSTEIAFNIERYIGLETYIQSLGLSIGNESGNLGYIGLNL